MQGRKIFHHFEKEDEGQQEVTKNSPIILEVPVPVSSKRDYIAILWNNYRLAKSRVEKSLILNEICRNLGLHRQSAIRLMNKPCEPKLSRGSSKGNRGYSSESKFHLVKLWKKMNRPGGKLMRAMIPFWLDFYLEDDCTLGIRQELMSMSKSSIDEFLKPARAEWRRKRNTGTKAAKPSVQSWVPVKQVGFRTKRVGTIEIDTVAHCGESLAGQFFWTLNMTDIVSGWTTAEVVWNKSGEEISLALERAESESFFEWETLCSDCGTEFLNRFVVHEFCRDPRRKKPILQFRGRPYKSNDQCFIEQKNNVFVRKLLGYERLGSRKMQDLLNRTYKDWALLHNHFIAQSKLVSKVRIGSKIKKTYDEPMTPYERLLSSNDVSLEQKDRLVREHAKLNPMELRHQVHRRLKIIFRWHDIERSKRGNLAA
jgi:hypothetical protein